MGRFQKPVSAVLGPGQPPLRRTTLADDLHAFPLMVLEAVLDALSASQGMVKL